jgi:hypothetical protein
VLDREHVHPQPFPTGRFAARLALATLAGMMAGVGVLGGLYWWYV